MPKPVVACLAVEEVVFIRLWDACSRGNDVVGPLDGIIDCSSAETREIIWCLAEGVYHLGGGIVGVAIFHQSSAKVFFE